MIGTQLGPYEVLSALGAGGMGEVYRARDRRLDREVAIKILPGHLASNAQFRERFDREARAISQLNHPNICTLHDVGQENGTSYLVMELLEGESLADRLAKGPLSIEQVLRYGAQIADALHRAHRHGIVHRDLKPGNIMITKSGAKLLDFGLAKGSGAAASPISHSGLTEQKPLTAEGTILGTYQYMSPEQLEGLEADARTDIFALGAVLYEMATGRRAFDGKTKTSLIAAIVSTEPPPISQVQPLTPPAFEHVVAKCLRKEPDERWQSAHDVAETLRWIGGGTSSGALPVVSRPRRPVWVWAALALVPILAIAAWTQWPRQTQRSPRYHFTVPGIGPGYGGALSAALSPQSDALLFIATNESGTLQLFQRRFDSFEAKPVAGTEGAAGSYTWSEDGKSIAFTRGGKLMRVAADGGAPQFVAEPGGRGLAYGKGFILAGDMNGGIRKISVATGSVALITKPVSAQGELGHILPTLLPDGDHFLFSAFGRHPRGPQHHNVYVGSLESGDVELLGVFPSALDYGGGYVFYARDGVLVAQPFDPATRRVSGEPVTVARNVRAHSVIGSTALHAAPDGTIAWRERELPHLLRVVDLKGNVRSTIGAQASYSSVRANRDGSSVVVSRIDPAAGTEDLEVYEVARPTRTRITFDPTTEFHGVFSPDDSQLYYATDLNGMPDIHVRSTDGTGADRQLVAGVGEQQPCDVSPDGRSLLYVSMEAANKTGLFILPLDGGKAYAVVSTPGAVRCGRFSGDGQWISYHSNVSGRYEVYVKPVSGRGAARQVSVDGGTAARWSRDGNTLYFGGLDRRTLYAVTRTGQTFGEPVVAFTYPSDVDQFDVLGNDTFVLVERDDEAASPPIHVVVRWPDGAS